MQNKELTMEHTCIKENDWGKVHEFMNSIKGVKASMIMVSFAILIQVGTFLYLWGGLSTTVGFHDKQIVKLEGQVELLKDKR